MKTPKTAFQDYTEEKPLMLDVPYSDEELEYQRFLYHRLENARDQRESDYQEFDDQTYSDWYDDNARAANAYNPPKKNKEDTRIVTGTTQEKENTLLSALLNYNLEPNVTAYDKQNVQIMELGKTIEELVEKSRNMEYYEEKRPLVYKELLDQGTCFVEEVKKEYIKVEKEMKNQNWYEDGVKFSSLKWEKRIKKMYAQCEVNLLQGKSVYMGNVREFFLDNQPYAFIYDRVPYDEAKYIYGAWERWKYVPENITKFADEEIESDPYQNWTLYDMQDEMVEVIKYQDPKNNEYQIILNGVMMLPVGFPLTAISPSGKFTFSKGDTEPISKFFAYSKSIPAKTKVDQSISDELLKMMILKTQQSYKPPMANNTNKVLTSKVFYPGTFTNHINPNNLQPLVDAKGVTQAEFNMFELMKKLMDEKSVSPTFSGDLTKKGTTATEIMEVKRQQMMKLGAAILGVIALERQMTELRIHNILATWTAPVDTKVDEVKKRLKNVYRTVSVESTFENGMSGEKIVDFDPDKAKGFSSEDIMVLEDYMKKEKGRNVRFVFLNPDEIKSIAYYWHINIVPTERDSSQLDRVLFSQTLKEAYAFFGPQSINQDNARERFAIMAGEDPEKFFNQGQSGTMQQPMMQPQQGQQGQSELQKQVQQAVANPEVQQPTLNSLVKAG